MIQWILLQGKIVGSLDVLQTKWSWITDPDTDHPNGTLSLCFFSLDLKKIIPVKKWGMLFFSPILMNKYTSLKTEPLGAHMNEQ